MITHHWWESERAKYELAISEVVETECERGEPALIRRRRELLSTLSLVPVDESIMKSAKVLIAPGALPINAAPDAVHIAAASVAECEFLLTWNFRHIANGRIRKEVERILANHG